MRGRAASDTTGRVAALLADGPALLLSIPLWIWWAVWRGGYPTTVWAPGLLYLAALAALLAWFVPRPPLGRARSIALAALLGLTAWSALSLLWAPDRGLAWATAGRQWLLVAAFALPLLWPPGERALRVAVCAWPFAAAAGAVVAVATALDQASALDTGRLITPTGYPNASAALFLMGALPATVLAARRSLLAPLRVALLALAGGLVGAALLCQSRGGVLAGVLALLVVFACSRERIRLAIAATIVAGGVALAAPALLDLRRAIEADGRGAAVEHVAIVLVLLVAGLLLAAALYVAVD